MKLNQAFIISLSDWLINVSAGWFGAAFIFPAFSKVSKKVNIWLLIMNIGFAIFSFGLGVSLKLK
ncbi:hypothetical protein A2767_04030 [Candidatus Roizmanbacteria bacterium RIFCSPHIGHO2_01_FULL_35_10]|uniref:Uncharacterized protein n=1 Tax=Candidatus Roizmanbacteria bacterium RIFCSPLOWO2_01_FULL_35_13 TaxID=1802055 RepID=A0A1F7IFJ4_9BACT|nr:MAG: hypothetical protein A2767_04030 [Candidatus Roizmanbacteria bacterium RIFCSPHIGHO2_01_FULL_35_10]OGK42121.1 MAG: hypothetical protein A3A74_04760 [Candidatus Roizmanbacteria bacterium RIFCSPLOWO2_01_FULL_35_13]